LAAAANGFSTAGVGGDGGVGVEDDAAGVGATAVGAAVGVSSLRKFSLYFVFASSAAETAGPPAGLSSVLSAVASAKAEALAKEDGFSAAGEGCDGAIGASAVASSL
jgi:hypothetical protein